MHIANISAFIQCGRIQRKIVFDRLVLLFVPVNCLLCWGTIKLHNNKQFRWISDGGMPCKWERNTNNRICISADNTEHFSWHRNRWTSLFFRWSHLFGICVCVLRSFFYIFFFIRSLPTAQSSIYCCIAFWKKNNILFVFETGKKDYSYNSWLYNLTSETTQSMYERENIQLIARTLYYYKYWRISNMIPFPCPSNAAMLNIHK